MNESMTDHFDADGYPTETALDRLRTWPVTDPKGWLEFARSLWWQRDWGWPALEGEVSTGGWSGNESIIGAMRDAHILWHQVWWQTRKGGHYLLFISRPDALAFPTNAKITPEGVTEC